MSEKCVMCNVVVWGGLGKFTPSIYVLGMEGPSVYVFMFMFIDIARGEVCLDLLVKNV